jgi:hopanoid C-3 methylase
MSSDVHENLPAARTAGPGIGSAVVRQAGHEVRIIDLQTETEKDYFRVIDSWQPDAVAFSCNYLANVPEVLDLAKLTKEKLPRCFLLVGGHSPSFIAREILEHSEGAIDCVLKGDGKANIVQLLLAIEHDRKSLTKVPGVVTNDATGRDRNS